MLARIHDSEQPSGVRGQDAGRTGLQSRCTLSFIRPGKPYIESINDRPRDEHLDERLFVPTPRQAVN